MATLRELKKRLRSTETTGQLAGAMRTVATAKYSKVSAAHNACTPYLEALAGCGSGTALPRGEKAGVPVYVLFSGNRGLCGGFHHELFAFLSETLKGESEYALVPCGRMAVEYCREKKLPVLKEFFPADVPDFTDAKALASFLTELYRSGGANSIDFVYQRFYNMLRQKPEKTRFLPEEGENSVDGELIFFPDRETVESELAPLSLAAECYSVLLSSASGAQAATLMAMRSAYDNAEASSRKLNVEINRLRQAAVTSSVIETASDTRND